MPITYPWYSYKFNHNFIQISMLINFVDKIVFSEASSKWMLSKKTQSKNDTCFEITRDTNLPQHTSFSASLSSIVHYFFHISWWLSPSDIISKIILLDIESIDAMRLVSLFSQIFCSIQTTTTKNEKKIQINDI